LFKLQLVTYNDICEYVFILWSSDRKRISNQNVVTWLVHTAYTFLQGLKLPLL
jgi:hypothetical protein